jgi:predicted enzyme related to lactoylglutathione lyase
LNVQSVQNSADVLAIVRGAGGAIRTTTRRLAVDGLIALNADSRGTRIALAAPARVN